MACPVSSCQVSLPVAAGAAMRAIPFRVCSADCSSAALLLDQHTRLRKKLFGGGELLFLIAAGAADGRNDFGRDPFAERLGLGLVRAEDDGVKAGFVDDGGVLLATDRIGEVSLTHLIFIEPLGHACRGCEIQHVTYIFQDEPRFAVTLDRADGGLLIGKGLQCVHGGSFHKFIV